MRKRPAKCKGLRRFAERIHKCVQPGAPVADIRENTVECGVGFFQACQHIRRSSLLRRSLVEKRCAAAGKSRGPSFLGLYHPVQKLPQTPIRPIPWKYMD